MVRYIYSQDRAVTTTDNEFVWSYEVLEDRQIAPGLWYPVHCTDTRTYSKERATWQRAQAPPNDDPHRPDHYAPHKSELILTKVALLDEKAAEPDLTVKLPNGLDIHTEE